MSHRDTIARLLTEVNRYLTLLVRRKPQLRLMFSPETVRYLTKGRIFFMQSNTRLAPVDYRSSYSNVFHCCVQKTGSQWIGSLLADLMTYRYCGLRHYAYQTWTRKGYDPRRLTERSFTEPFPINTVVSPLYIDYANYTNIPKMGKHKAFFVTRDPRDIVVSWYFSSRYSHIPIGDIPVIREALNGMSIEDGMIYSIDYLEDFGLFSTLRSWAEADRKDPNILIVRYEDIAGSDFAAFRQLFSELDIRIPDNVLEELIGAYSFKRLSGRREGVEDQKSHIRKGGAGSWKKYFDGRIASRFEEVTGDLIEKLGCAKT
jgi:hypothetical protein